MRTFSFVAVFVVSIAWTAGSARADLLPPDACTSPGQPCQVAGPHYDQAGTCQATTCTKGLPDGQGGVTTTTYACNLCVADGAGGISGAAGAGGHGTGGSAGGGAAGAGGNAAGGAGGQRPGPGPKNEPSKSGCTVAGGASDLDLAALLLLGLAFLRRRSLKE